MKLIELKLLDARMADYLPAYATPGSAGLDLRACIDAPLLIEPGQAALIATGLAMHIGDPGLAALLLVGGFLDPGPLVATGLIALAYALGFALGCLMFGFDGAAGRRRGHQLLAL